MQNRERDIMNQTLDDTPLRFNGNQQLLDAFQTLTILNESTDDHLFLVDWKAGLIYFSDDISKCYPLSENFKDGYAISEWLSIVYERDVASLSADLNAIQNKIKDTHNIEYRLTDREGNLIWVSSRGKSQYDEEHDTYTMIGRISNSALMGKTDSMTGLKNSSKLFEDLEIILQNKEEGFLLILGIDNFKNINTKYGRAHGNHVLKQITAILESSVDEKLPIYRLDGDHFAINCIHYETSMVKSLYHALQQEIMEICTISAGAVNYPITDVHDTNALFNYAENALEKAKKAGKNRLTFFSMKDYSEQLSMVDLTEELRSSVQNNFKGFSLYYQPQIDMQNLELTGAEALLRFHSAYHGMVSPYLFIDLLEQSRMIIPVGKWVLREAIFQCKKWRNFHKDFNISINVSYLQLQTNDLLETIFTLLDEAELPGNAITLELTESMQLQDYNSYNHLFYQLGKRGVQVAIDDFGTGYSSMSYLKSLAVDEIKIDRCFISRIHLSAYNYRLLSNMLELAQSAQIRVVCEGVESINELLTLKQLGPELLQGFYFSAPICAEDFFNRFIKNNTEQLGWQEAFRSKMDAQNAPLPSTSLEIDYRNILDKLDEVIYIIDQESYELYYMNPAGKRMTGVRDYKGLKCYKVIQNKKDPCPDCPGLKANGNCFKIYQHTNLHLNNQMMMKDKKIRWQGKDAILKIGFDIFAIDQKSQDLDEELNIDEHILAILTNFDGKKDLPKAIQELLYEIGSFHQAERSYLFLYSNNTSSFCDIYEWCEYQVESHQAQLFSLSNTEIESWIETLKRGESLIVKDISSYRETAPDLWKRLHHNNIRRLILTPLLYEHNLVGFIGVDNAKFLSYNDKLLTKIVPFVSNKLMEHGYLQAQDMIASMMKDKIQREDILKATKLGLWNIEIDTNTGINRMSVDSNMSDLLGITESLTKEECYQHWYQNIADGYYYHVSNALKEIMHSNKIIELEYTWIHPYRGEVPARLVGILSHSTNGVYHLKGYYRITGDMIQKNFLHTQDMEVFEYNEKRGSIYFHTERKLIRGERGKELNFPDCWIDHKMVHPYFESSFRNIFSSVKNHKEDQILELMLKNKKDEFEWFRLESHHISHDIQDINTLIISLYPISDNQNLQMQYIRRNDFYQAILSEAVAYAEVDLTTGRMQDGGGLWAIYLKESKYHNLTFQQLIDLHLRHVVFPEDHDEYYRLMNVEAMKKNYQQGKSASNYQFRRKFESGNYRWVELSIHIFQEHITERMYALIYLKDIDDTKRRYLEQERAATLDPLTGLLNRRTFETYVKHYMQDIAKSSEVSVLLLFDLDDFKQINDTLGHQTGDDVLKHFASVLRSAFRSTDFVGRLGGDEFLVFMKNFQSKDILNKRLLDLQEKLREGIPEIESICCSIGISLIEADNFNYEDALRQADTALYSSKREQKNTFRYWKP